MPGVTISAGYGAGGSVVARRLADRLGYQLLDRAISGQVADQLHCTVEEAQDGRARRPLAERFLAVLAPLATTVIGTDLTDLPAVSDDAQEFRERAEAIMRQALHEGAVILGRGGAAAFCHEPGVLRVRLFGSPHARIAQAARVEGVDEQTATRRLPEVDHARAQYVHRLYGRDIDDPDLFHLQIDSTVLSPERCVEIIATAFAGLPH